jgi:hypothetical protein
MSTKVKNIFSAKNLTQIFLGMAIIAVAGLNVKLAMRSQDWSFLSLMNIESLGQGTSEKNTTDSLTTYNKDKSDCSKEFDLNAAGEIYIFGKYWKPPVYAIIKGKYTKTYTKVDIDCPVGTKFNSCKTCNCPDFWAGKCGIPLEFL